MSIFMTILSFAVISQIFAEQSQTQGAVEPVQQAAPAEDNHPNTRIFSEAAEGANSAIAPARQTEIPDAPKSPTSASTSVETTTVAGPGY